MMKNLPLIRSIDEFDAFTADEIRALFGGKALGLYEAHKLGISIPPTWVISACHVNQISPETLQFLPHSSFAVRSSSPFEDSQNTSFAGIFESKLHVRKEDLSQAICEVFLSSKSSKVSNYIGSANLQMHVILQPMIETAYVGVLFSKHPSPATVYENDLIVIEMSSSSGEKLVQGEITPFRFKGTFADLVHTIDAPWISTLLDSVFLLKNFHHHDVDIEFAITPNHQFVLLQQRPISRICHSHTLDLSLYEKKYKRSLLSLDIEFLIDGCARFLAPYLEVPYSLEQWMVMITNREGSQELWVHAGLDQAVISYLSDRMNVNQLTTKYLYNTNLIRETHYSKFLDRKRPLEERFLEWCEFFTPLTAHYYAPMFIIDALHKNLLRECKKIDPIHAEDDLFFLGTFNILSLMELLQAELRTFPSIERLSALSYQYGFLKCHQPYEQGYSPDELMGLLQETPPLKDPKDEERYALLQTKYLQVKSLLENFRRWLTFRNQEMEYFLFATLSSRPLFEEISSFLNVSVKELWNSSKASILNALKTKNFVPISHEELTIYHSQGTTKLANNLTILGTSGTSNTTLSGKKIYGEGSLQARVKIAFNPNSLENLPPFVEPTVLVTGMTTPDFVPYLKKHFIALITDEGGILCHAAIVARELRLPCIVGTGIATELLKDGMLLQINFDRGTIDIVF